MKYYYICRHCKKDENCKGYVERTEDSFSAVYFCPKFIHDNGTPFSQADRIRSFSDEELAEFIRELNERCLAGAGMVDCSNNTDCINCKGIVLKWLQSEVEE